MSLRVRSKIWIENDDGKLVIGTGRLKILEAIMESGSMNKAATQLKQPFRAVWGKIKATEQRCGFKLVERTAEGSRLTIEGLDLLRVYTRLRNQCETYADNRFLELCTDIPFNAAATTKDEDDRGTDLPPSAADAQETAGENE